MEQLKNENLRKQHEEETFVKHQQLQHTAKMVKLPFLLVNIFAYIALSIFLVLLAFYKFPLLLVDKLPPYYWNSPAGLEVAKKIVTDVIGSLMGNYGLYLLISATVLIVMTQIHKIIAPIIVAKKMKEIDFDAELWLEKHKAYVVDPQTGTVNKRMLKKDKKNKWIIEAAVWVAKPDLQVKKNTLIASICDAVVAIPGVILLVIGLIYLVLPILGNFAGAIKFMPIIIRPELIIGIVLAIAEMIVIGVFGGKSEKERNAYIESLGAKQIEENVSEQPEQNA